jgi:hypothetical protein
MIPITEYSTDAAAPTIIYGKHDSDTHQAYPLKVDKATSSISAIEFEHHEIHEGDSFTCDFVRNVGNGLNLDMILTTPDTAKWSHLTYELDTEVAAILKIYEGAITGAGTSCTIYNRNRNSAATSSCLVANMPLTVTTGTTLIRNFHLGTGKTFGGGSRSTHEIILKQNTKYLFRITNDTTSNNYISLKLDWYEHTNT